MVCKHCRLLRPESVALGNHVDGKKRFNPGKVMLIGPIVAGALYWATGSQGALEKVDERR